MGDVAMLPHALRAFKLAHPTVKITVATKAAFCSFFDGLDVDFLVIDTDNKHRGLLGLRRFASEARSIGVDAVADMHNVLRSKIVRLMLQAYGLRTAVINKDRLTKWMRMGSNPEFASELKHTVIRYCDVLRNLGFEFDDPTPAAPYHIINPLGEKNGVWIGFAPFSAQIGKTYPLESSRRVVELLAAKYDRVFIHSGGGDEARFADEVECKYPNVTALHGKMELRQELALISNLDCVVSMDSLVMHMAALVGTPVVSVWGATHPTLGFLGYGCDRDGIVQLDMECRPCSVYGKKKCKYGDYRCINDIQPTVVVDRVAQLLAKHESREE